MEGRKGNIITRVENSKKIPWGKPQTEFKVLALGKKDRKTDIALVHGVLCTINRGYITHSRKHPTDKLRKKLGLLKMLTIITKKGMTVCQIIFLYQPSIESFPLLMTLLNRNLSKAPKKIQRKSRRKQ